jgi:hypothetical protein
MTWRYISGELSVRLGQLQAAAPDPQRARELGRLRSAAETLPASALPAVATRALALADQLCWEALRRGDLPNFDRQASLSQDLWEFGLGARLLREDPDLGAEKPVRTGDP